MIGVTINDKQYNIMTDWPDMTIRQSIEVYKAITFAPPKLLEQYNAKSQDELDSVEVDNDDIHRKFPAFYGELLCLCSDIPEEVVAMASSGDRWTKYSEYVEPLVRGLIDGLVDIEPIDSFEFNGETYYLPKSKDHLGVERFGNYMETIEFTESKDLKFFGAELEGGIYTYAANMVSVLCRPKGEKYDEAVSLKRAELFMDLPMDVCMGVFFFAINSMSTYMVTMAPYLLPAGSRLKKPLEKLTLAISDGMAVS